MSQPPEPQADHERREILESRIGLALTEIAPPGWRLADLCASLTVDTQRLRLTVLMDDGREAVASGMDDGLQRQIIEALAELRALMNRPGAGTWFSMRLAATPDGYSVAYDFHHEPPWEPPLDPEMYVRDFEAYPRDVMRLPGWLRARLKEAQPERVIGGFTDSGPMSMEDQRDWADEAAALLSQTLPAGNHQTTIHYRELGGYVEMTSGVLNFRMREVPWEPPAKLEEMLRRLRAGMYEEGAGTWFGVRLQLSRLSRISLEFDRTDEPEWANPPAEGAYREELALFPRAPEAIPYWLARHAGPATGPELNVARPFDATLPFPGYPNGYPTFAGRPALSDEERDGLSAYLENAPVVLTLDGGEPDLFDASGATGIPREYRTDGSWVWPSAVAYYLRTHGVAPERGLVEHIRSRGFQIPDVDQGVRDAAVAAIESGSV